MKTFIWSSDYEFYLANSETKEEAIAMLLRTKTCNYRLQGGARESVGVGIDGKHKFKKVDEVELSESAQIKFMEDFNLALKEDPLIIEQDSSACISHTNE